MAGYLCSSLGILVFWGLAHFQDAAVLKADRPLTYLQEEPFTVVNNDEAHSLHREKEPRKESRLKRQSGENNESNKIMKTLTSLVNSVKEQIDERKRADEEQSDIINILRNKLTILEGAIDHVRDELTSNITSLQDGLELHVIEYENRTSEVLRLGEKLENEESNCKKLAPNVSLLQEQMDDQHGANISHIETELEKLTRANENITSDIDDLREEFASRTADVRNNLTLAIGSLEERLDLKENTDGILVTNVTSLHERIELQEHTDDQLSSYLSRLQVRLNNQEYADTNLASNLSSMQRKRDQQEDTDTRLTSNLTRLQERLNHQENKDKLITSNLTSLQAILASYLTDLQEKLTSDFASLLTRLERLESTKLQTDALKKSLHQAESKWASDLKELEKRIQFAHREVTENCGHERREPKEALCLEYKFQNSCYHVVWQLLTWKHAEEKCTSLGGNLAEVESSAEHNYLKRMSFGKMCELSIVQTTTPTKTDTLSPAEDNTTDVTNTTEMAVTTQTPYPLLPASNESLVLGQTSSPEGPPDASNTTASVIVGQTTPPNSEPVSTQTTPSEPVVPEQTRSVKSQTTSSVPLSHPDTKGAQDSMVRIENATSVLGVYTPPPVTLPSVTGDVVIQHESVDVRGNETVFIAENHRRNVTNDTETTVTDSPLGTTVVFHDVSNVTEMPHNTTKIKKPQSVTVTDMLQNVTVKYIPQNVNVTDMPEDVTVTDMPQNVTETEIPHNVTEKEVFMNAADTATKPSLLNATYSLNVTSDRKGSSPTIPYYARTKEWERKEWQRMLSTTEGPDAESVTHEMTTTEVTMNRTSVPQRATDITSLGGMDTDEWIVTASPEDTNVTESFTSDLPPQDTEITSSGDTAKESAATTSQGVTFTSVVSRVDTGITSSGDTDTDEGVATPTSQDTNVTDPLAVYGNFTAAPKETRYTEIDWPLNTTTERVETSKDDSQPATSAVDLSATVSGDTTIRPEDFSDLPRNHTFTTAPRYTDIPWPRKTDSSFEKEGLTSRPENVTAKLDISTPSLGNITAEMNVSGMSSEKPNATSLGPEDTMTDVSSSTAEPAVVTTEEVQYTEIEWPEKPPSPTDKPDVTRKKGLSSTTDVEVSNYTTTLVEVTSLTQNVTTTEEPGTSTSKAVVYTEIPWPRKTSTASTTEAATDEPLTSSTLLDHQNVTTQNTTVSSLDTAGDSSTVSSTESLETTVAVEVKYTEVMLPRKTESTTASVEMTSKPVEKLTTVPTDKSITEKVKYTEVPRANTTIPPAVSTESTATITKYSEVTRANTTVISEKSTSKSPQTAKPPTKTTKPPKSTKPTKATKLPRTTATTKVIKYTEIPRITTSPTKAGENVTGATTEAAIYTEVPRKTPAAAENLTTTTAVKYTEIPREATPQTKTTTTKSPVIRTKEWERKELERQHTTTPVSLITSAGVNKSVSVPIVSENVTEKAVHSTMDLVTTPAQPGVTSDAEYTEVPRSPKPGPATVRPTPQSVTPQFKLSDVTLLENVTDVTHPLKDSITSIAPNTTSEYEEVKYTEVPSVRPTKPTKAAEEIYTEEARPRPTTPFAKSKTTEDSTARSAPGLGPDDFTRSPDTELPVTEPESGSGALDESGSGVTTESGSGEQDLTTETGSGAADITTESGSIGTDMESTLTWLYDTLPTTTTQESISKASTQVPPTDRVIHIYEETVTTTGMTGVTKEGGVFSTIISWVSSTVSPLFPSTEADDSTGNKTTTEDKGTVEASSLPGVGEAKTTQSPKKTTRSPPKTTKPPKKATKSPKTTYSPTTTKSPRTTESPETTESLETTKSPKDTKPPEATKPPKATKPTKATRPPKATKPTKATKPPTTTEPITTTLSPVTTEPPETMMPPKTTKAPKATKPPKVTKPHKETKPTKATKPPKTTIPPKTTTTPTPAKSTQKPQIKDTIATTTVQQKEPGQMTTEEPAVGPTTSEPLSTHIRPPLISIMVSLSRGPDTSTYYSKMFSTTLTRPPTTPATPRIVTPKPVSKEPSDELVETTELDEAETTTSLVEVFFTKRPTTKAPRRTTKAPNRTTKAPKATKAPKLTTKAPKLTTKEPKLTTKTPKLTSKAPKLTTTLSPVTTEPPDTMMPPKTTKAPKATKPPKLTTKVPKLTTKAPKLTTKAPKLTTKKPKLTTKDPKLTTAPKLTTKEPKLTTKEPELTTKEPKKTTKAPKRTTKAPKQTDSPDMTTKTPKKTVKPLTTEGPETTKAPQTTPIPTTPRPLTIVSTMHKHRASSQTTTTESMTSQVTAPPTTRSWIVTTTRRKGLEVDVLYPPGPRPDLSAARPESVTLTVYRAVKDVYNVSKETMMETLHQARGAQISELKALGLKERLQQTEANWTSDLKRIEDKLRVIPICEATPRFQSSCYSVVKKRVTWRTANDECRSLGGKMAEIESAGERDHVKKIADASGLSELWLGGTDTENEGMWKWACSGSAFSFTDWRKGEPNDAFGGEDCLTLVKADGWTWNDDNCDKELSSALCEFSSPF